MCCPVDVCVTAGLKVDDRSVWKGRLLRQLAHSSDGTHISVLPEAMMHRSACGGCPIVALATSTPAEANAGAACAAAELRSRGVVRWGVSVVVALVVVVRVVTVVAVIVTVSVDVLGAFMPVCPVQSYSFGWMHPLVSAMEAEGHVTDPALLGQHWSPAQLPQAPSRQQGTGWSKAQFSGGLCGDAPGAPPLWGAVGIQGARATDLFGGVLTGSPGPTTCGGVCGVSGAAGSRAEGPAVAL
mmetsp:Transcript_99149/g.280830  ORF Transcript_99149/g.280830 Transcript_99149/m.280830 type:complete len:241 (-) Transcript_99149:1229-1951(-)